MTSTGQLQVVDLGGQQTTHQLNTTKGFTYIGRGVDNDVVLNGPQMAPFQAILDHRAKPYTLTLIDRARTAQVGGLALRQHTKAPLTHQTTIQLNGFTLVFLEPPIPSSPSPTPTSNGTHHQVEWERQPAPNKNEHTAPVLSVGASSKLPFVLHPITPRTYIKRWPGKQVAGSTTLSNNTLTPLTVELTGEDADYECEFVFAHPGGADRTRTITVQLAPGEQMTQSFTITLPGYRLMGLSARLHRFRVTAIPTTPQHTFQAVSGQITARPILGPGLLSLLCMGLFALFIPLLMWFGTEFLTPAPRSFALNNPRTLKPAEVYRPLSEIKISMIKQESAVKPPVEAVSTEITYEDLFKEIAAEYELDWRMLAMQGYYESHLDPQAVGQLQEMGIMQIMPMTWNNMAPIAAVDIQSPYTIDVQSPYNPRNNIRVGAAYMAYLKEYFRVRGYTEPQWAIVAYNWGPHNVERLLGNQGTMLDVPYRTRQYAYKILQANEQTLSTIPQLQEVVVWPPIKE